MKPLPTSPQSPWEIIGSGFELGMSAYVKLFMATSLIAFIQFLPSVDMAVRVGDVTITPEIQLQGIGRQLLLLFPMILILLLVQGMVLARLDHLARGEPADYRSEWRIALRAYLPMLGAFLLCIGIGAVGGVLGGIIGLLTGAVGALLMGKAGFLPFFLLGLCTVLIYMVIYLLFMQYCIVLERKGPIDAINRSFRMVYGRWWHTFLPLFIIFVVVMVIAFLGVLMLGAPFMHAADAMTGRGLFIKGVMQMVGSALISPFMLSVMYCLYQDLKLRAPET